MEHAINRAWWAMVIRGVLALVFGILTLAVPTITVLVLVMFFGGFCLAEGILSVAAAIQGGTPHHRWWAFLLQGLVSIAIALITLLSPGITALALVFWIAAWAILTGLLEIITAIRLRKVIRGEALLMVMGALSLLFGVLVFVAPAAGILAIVMWIGVFALVWGAIHIALGLRMRKYREEIAVVAEPVHAA